MHILIGQPNFTEAVVLLQLHPQHLIRTFKLSSNQGTWVSKKFSLKIEASSVQTKERQLNPCPVNKASLWHDFYTWMDNSTTNMI